MTRTPSRKDVAQHLLRLQNASESFQGFVELFFPDRTFPEFQLHLLNILDRFEKNQLDEQNLLITMPPRFGKALALDTPILTTEGWSTMHEVQPGQYVFDEHGRPTRVVAKSPVWRSRPTYACRFDTGETIIADAAHEWPVRFCRKQAVSRHETKALHDYYQSTQDPRKPAIRAAGPLTLPHKELPIDPYVLGVWLGDGRRQSAVICSADQFIVDEIKRIEGAVTHCARRGCFMHFRPGPSIRAGVARAATFQARLRSLALLDNKHIPGAYMTASPDQRLALLQGLIDTDGHIAPNGTVEFSNSNERLARDALALIQSLGVKASFHTCVTASGRPGYRIHFYHAEAARLPRKRKRCRHQERSPTHYMVIEPAGFADTVCIEVDSPSHLFLAGRSLIPTCNSEYCSLFFPSYFIARNPARYIMSSSYNTQLATDFGRQIRTIVEDPLVRQAFPNFHLSPDSRSAEVWRTEDNGAYFGVGLGGTTTGRPANLLIVDDPIKSREEADSMLIRNRVWNYFTSALSTRLQPQPDGTPGKRIVILTRWHPDDLAGRIMQSSEWKEGLWKHVNFQAIVERDTKVRVPRSALPKDDPRHISSIALVSSGKRYVTEPREESLWPERFPLKDLQRRRALNEREFTSLYQQKPYIPGGNLIKADWWRNTPADMPIQQLPTIVIGVDTAFKSKEQNDYSCAIVAGIDQLGDIHIIDVVRGKWEYPDLKRRLIQLNNQWRGRGLRAFYVEDKASGQSIIQELRKTAGLSVIPYKVTFDKVARVNAILPLIEGGRVHLSEEARWLDPFVEECTAFPNATNDDQVDALTIVLDVLSKTGLVTAWEDLAQVSAQPLDPVSLKARSLSELVNHNQPNFKGYGVI